MSIHRVCVAFILSILLVSCNKPTEQIKSNDQGAQTTAAKVYPHSEAFIQKLHGKIYLLERDICASCHGKDASGGTARVSCTKCHSSYPHEPGWALANSHGQNFSAGTDNERQVCLNCHRADNSNATVSCQTCHKAFPHSDGFKDGEHGTFAKSYEGKCTACHTDYKRLMPNMGDTGCASCHGDSTLEIRWKEKNLPAPAPPVKKQDVKYFQKNPNRGTASKPTKKKAAPAKTN